MGVILLDEWFFWLIYAKVSIKNKEFSHEKIKIYRDTNR